MNAHVSAHETVCALLEDIRGELIRRSIRSPKIEEATDDIETLTKAYMTPTRPESVFEHCHLTPKELRVIDLLHLRINRAISRETIMDLLYGGDPNGGPDQKIVDVFICKIRAKIKGSGFHIMTQRSDGYSLRVGEQDTKPYRTDFEGQMMGCNLAAVASTLKASLGSVVPFDQFGFVASVVQKIIWRLRTRFKGKYKIETVDGIGYRMKYATPTLALTALQGLAA